jgi:hypothetical protein
MASFIQTITVEVKIYSADIYRNTQNYRLWADSDADSDTDFA